MAGTKRRRGSAKSAAASGGGSGGGGTSTGTTGSTSNSSKKAAAASNSNVLWKVVQRLSEIATSNNDRAVRVLVAFGEAKVVMDYHQKSTASSSATTTSDICWDAYWVVIATHVMNRLLLLVPQDPEALVVLAALCDFMSQIFAREDKLLDKAVSFPPSRSLVARAILSSTVASLQCLTTSILEESSVKQKNVILCGATAALDRLVHLQQAQTDAIVVDWSLQNLEAACAAVPATAQEEECVTKLEQLQQGLTAAAAAVPPPPRAKQPRSSRSTRRKSSSSSTTTTNTRSTSPSTNIMAEDLAALTQALENLMGQQHRLMDARNPVKKWASIALVWYRQGSVQLLQCVHTLVQQGPFVLQRGAEDHDQDDDDDDDDDEHDTTATSITGNSNGDLLRLLCRLLAIVAESGTNCGIRPPVGRMDQYIASLFTASRETTSTSSASSTSSAAAIMGSIDDFGSSKEKTTMRADIRDWTMVAIHDVLQVHKQCLVESPYQLVNDVADGIAAGAATLPPKVFTAPQLSTTLSLLCRAAAVSMASSGYAEHNDVVKTMSSMSAAMVLQMLGDDQVALDCRLVQWALHQLAETLRLLERQTPSSSATYLSDSSEERDETLERIFLLSKELTEPQAPENENDKKSKKKKKDSNVSLQDDEDEDMFSYGFASSSKKCTYAGMWTVRSEITNEDLLSLFLRALQPSKNNGMVPGNKLINFLTNMTRRAYDTRVQASITLKPSSSADTPAVAAASTKDDVDSKPKAKGGRKRTAAATVASAKSTSTGGGGRKSKQRKTTKEQAVVTATTNDGSEDVEANDAADSGGEEYKRISSSRAALARDALTALRYCLTMQTIPSSGLAQSIRNGLTTSQVLELLKLGDLLDKVLIKTRLGASKFATTPRATTDEEGGGPPGDGTLSSNTNVHSKEFSTMEKTVWAMHMTMCQVLGRGQAEYDGTIRYLFSEAERKMIFQSIPADSGRNSAWPLSLPAAHHAFLVAHMTGTAVGPEHSSAEQFLVKQYIKSIGKALQNLHDIKPKPKEQSCLFLEDGIWLSYMDARTLIVAFSRLPNEFQRKGVEEMVAILLPALKKFETNQGGELEALTANAESSSFVARTVVVCSAMLSIIAYRSLRQVLFANAGPGSTHPPGFYNSNEWYYFERCFMGLFGDWECPVVPELESTSPGPSLITMKDKTIKEVKVMFETAFALGFETAQKDQCYLLFAAWNGLGKLLTEGGYSRIKLADGTSLQINADDYPKRLLQLRDDICLIHNELNKDDGVRTMPLAKMRSNLKSTLHRANILMGRLLETATSDEDEEVPMSLFCLLAALPTYVSSSIAAHTKPGSDYFSTTFSKQRSPSRQRGYSSESDRMASDVESVETEGGIFENDARADAMSRLHECCDAFGAAPIHPDWLDVGCMFQDGIRSADAIDNAETALRMLNKLSSTAFEQYNKNLLQALKAYKSGSDHEALELSLDLLPWNTHEPTYTSPLGPGHYSDDRDWKDDIGALFGLSEGVLDLVMDDSVIKNIEGAKESWCPNAAQRLIGRLQDRKRPLGGWETTIPELRAGGEWELLLAEALTTACLDVKRYPEEAPDDVVDSDDELEARAGAAKDLNYDNETLDKGYRALKRAQVWQLIMTLATSHLVPAAALLRMGINKIGRKPHPFSFHENNQDPYDVAPLSFVEQLGNVGYTSQLVRITTQETMALLSKLSTHGDDALSGTCHAVAAHLFVDTKTFADLEGLQSIRLAFVGLQSVLRLPDAILQKAAALEVLPYIIERLTLIVEDFSCTPSEEMDEDAELEVERLLTFYEASGSHTIDTIVGSSLDIFDVFKGKPMDALVQTCSTLSWSSLESRLESIKDLVAILCRAQVKTNDRSRACSAVLLGRLVGSEQTLLKRHPSTPPVVLNAVIKEFNGVDRAQIRNLILDDLCCLGDDVSPYSSHRVELSHLLLHMMSSVNAEGTDGTFEPAEFVYEVLVESFSSWPRAQQMNQLEHAFDTLLAFGCRFHSLNEIGSKILALESGGDPIVTGEGVVDLELVTKFFAFVKHLSDAFSGEDKMKVVDSPVNEKKNDEPHHSPKAIAPLGRRCSFVEKTGYHGQHWYNCYTCGLVWEKGCCTLCALVCHKGHDVSYSRYSSFFCDCAAEDGTASSENRVSCRCMMQLPEDEVKKLTEAERSSVNVAEQKVDYSTKRVDQKEPTFPSLSVEIAFKSFGRQTKLALSKLSKSSFGEPWFIALFDLLRQKFLAWKDASSSDAKILPVWNDITQASTRPAHRVPPFAFRKQLRGRHAKPLDLKHLSAKTMIPVRSAKGFQTRMSSDTSTNAHLLAKLSRHDITRCNLVADSRGRLVIAEPCSLVFCSAMPAAATRYGGKAYETPLSRQQMCILGSTTVAFNIVGMRLCPENERHLIVWGVSEACVVVIKPHWDGVETTIDLALDLDQNDGETDYLVKCDFVPGSQTNLVVGCGRYVRVFDISRSKDKRSNAVVAYNLGFEASLRDIALVPLSVSDGPESAVFPSRRPEQGTTSKMFMLLENGRLHSVDLKEDSEGRLEAPNDQPCELSGSVSLPTTGVRARSGSSVGIVGSAAKSLGEGSRIVYLKQSRILLYKCVSSCVLALLLDKDGNVEGSFELLPHVLSSEILWNGIDGHAIVGPYNHWTELGVVYNENGTFFRAACIGRSSRTNQPKVICVEFNEYDVRVKEIVWSSTGSLGLSLSLSFEGLCAFSMPFVGDAMKESRSFGERTYLCTATSAGSLLVFGEEVVDTVEMEGGNRNAQLALVSLSGISSLQVKRPVFPLTIFEKLRNISDCDEVVFMGDGTGCDSAELKSRLLRDRSSSLVCHRREGCTITISLRPKKTEKTSGAPEQSASTGLDRTHAIVALRILVGTTPSNVPTKIFVQGRPLDLLPRVKKWYSAPLTNEEISLGVRNGMVTVGIGPSFDSTSNSSVDSIEVYGTEREELAPWIPRSYIQSEGVDHGQTNLDTKEEAPHDIGNENDATKGLLLSAQSLSYLCGLSPQSAQPIVANQRDFLRELVEYTSYTKSKAVSETVRHLVRTLEPDERVRSSLYDESMLRGWSKALLDANQLVEETMMAESADVKALWESARSILRDCLSAVTKISRERPMNYLQAMESVAENEESAGSLAIEASRLILEGARRYLPCNDLIEGAGGIIELCLTEIAIDLNIERGKYLAKFDVVKRFLESSNLEVAEVACMAISSFCQRRGASNHKDADLFRVLQDLRLVAYKCDSCATCPMKEIRYTFLEEALDIDLCKECYAVAEKFAEKNKFSSSVQVTINGRTVGAVTKLTCAQLRQMHPVPLKKMDVEQVDVKATTRQSAQSDAMEEDEELQRALRMSLGETASEYGQEGAEPQAYEDFVSYLFASTLEVLSSMLKTGRRSTQLSPVLRLILELIRSSANRDSKNDRARRYAREVSQGISYLLSRKASDKGNFQGHVWSIISCIRSIQLLLLPDDDVLSFLDQLHADDDGRSKTHPDVVCEVHKIPAVRRRSAKGKNKDRRFYVCGKERGQRCNFFKWADDVETKPDGRARIPPQLRDIVQGYLWNRPVGNEVPLNVVLCELLEQELFDDNDDEVDIVLSATGHSQEKKKSQSPLSSLYGKEQLEIDSIDGVFCSREKLLDCIAPGAKGSAEEKKEFLLDLQGSGDSKVLLLEACLDLLALVADYKTDGVTRWFSLLCEIDISTSNSTETRNLARKVLKSLCGKKRAMYHSIRDHFSFGFQLQALYRNASQLFEAARLVGEKTRVCSPQWAATSKLDWTNLPFGALIGADELISENECPQARLRKIGKVLDDLWGIVKTGGESWRRFCGQFSLPPSHRSSRTHDSGSLSIEESISQAPPIAALFWLACALSGSYQVKALRLVDAALTDNEEAASPHNEDGNVAMSTSQMETDVVSAVSGNELVAPEKLLLSSDRKLSVDDVASFAFQYLLGGKSADLRRVAHHVAMKIVERMASDERGQLFQKLLSSNFLRIGTLGKACTEYLCFLQVLSQKLDSTVQLVEHAELVLDAFVNQMNAMKNDRSNGHCVVIESSHPSTKKKFDLAECAYCLKTTPVAIVKESPKVVARRDTSPSPRVARGVSQFSPSSKRVSPAKSASRSAKKWHPEQASAFSRYRLETLKLGGSSNEFSSFFALKHRLVVSDVILTVSDPRGRFVKNIAVYYSSRPVYSEASELKAEDYQWQKCATMTLPRGASRATATISHPIVAANLKIEYTDFYERPWGSKASDGSLLVHCPRCTRVVTNAHGVCGNCGEVAFQCRKCRHINYDRLDAFLCVECGYCASGSFAVEVTAAVASNAIAILSDKDYDRATRMLGAVNSINEEVKTALVSAFRQIEEQSALSKPIESVFNAEISRALKGLPPVLDGGKSKHDTYLDRVDKQGAVVRLAARPESHHSSARTSAAADRTRSLLRLARQIRSESGSAWDRRRSSDMIIRHLGRGPLVDSIEDERDLIGLLEDGNILDSSESLTRTIANARAGSRGSGSGQPASGDNAAAAGSSENKEPTVQETLEECQRLHMLMREAQRERYELKRRIGAWLRMNQGSLVDLGYPIQDEDPIDSCHCSVCGATVTLHLLLLWSRLFASRPKEVEVDREFLSLLLSESPTVGKTLSDCMRDVVKDIATKSEAGAKLVLAEIRNRLLATKDPVSAEILGKIMAVEGHFMAEEYSKLALELLAKRPI